jgi:glycosyltransferase involved in cell wall biosynthesis
MSGATVLRSSAPDQLPGARLHILILSDRDWTHPQAGGTGTTLFAHASRWIAWGHRVSVIACSYPGASARQEIGAVTLHRVGGRSTVFPRAIVRQLRGLVPDADVVLEVVNGVTFLTPLWCRAPRVTFVQHIHRHHYVQELGGAGRLPALLLETLPLQLLYRRSQFMTISRSTAEELAAHSIDPARIEVIYLGVEAAAFDLDRVARAPAPTLLYLGRLKRYKRIEILLDVLERIPEAVLEIAGDGDHREPLQQDIQSRGLSARVRMHGHVSEAHKRALYQRAWVNVTASSAEGWGHSVLEAAACRTPSAALALGGLREAIEDGRTGLLAADPVELGDKIRLLLNDSELRERLGAQARARVAEFTWDETARRTLGLLDRRRLAAHPGSLPAAGLIVPAGVAEGVVAAAGR